LSTSQSQYFDTETLKAYFGKTGKGNKMIADHHVKDYEGMVLRIKAGICW